MQSLGLTSPVAAAILLVPAVAFAALGVMADAPGEWGRGALIAWTALAVAVLAGAGLQAGGGVAPWLATLLGLAALMTGGPPGLAVAALAALLLLLPGSGLPSPRWLPVALAVPAALVALRQALSG